MENRFIKRLERTKDALSVDGNFATKVVLSNSSKLLAETEIDYVVNQGELYNSERQSCTKYRLLGTINTLFNNTLYNTIGPDSLSSFNDIMFRDRRELGGDILLYKDSIDLHLKELNGWQGYVTPVTIYSENTCNWVDLNPKREVFQIVTPNALNWHLMITYPYTSDTTHYLIKDGLKIVDAQIVNFDNGSRNMVALFTPIKHGLVAGDEVMIYNCGMIGADTGTSQTVHITGLPDGTMKEYVFVLDISYDAGTLINFVFARMRKIIDGAKSEYYLRKFKRITEPNDCEVYPLTFSNSIYSDPQYQFVFNGGSGNTIDIDISGMVDHKNRPLTELYFTAIKTNDRKTLTPIKSGFEMPFIDKVHSDLTSNHHFIELADIHRIHDGGALPIQSHEPIEPDIDGNGDLFYGDVVEYNKNTFVETILGEIHHRFNTTNRVNSGMVVVSSVTNTIVSVDGTTLQPVGDSSTDSIHFGVSLIITGYSDSFLSMGVRQEGYYYKPHHKIPLRNWSNYKQEGTTGITQQKVGLELTFSANTNGDIVFASNEEAVIGNATLNVNGTNDIPNYAESEGDKFFWLDIMDIGSPDTMVIGNVVDYPFLNGAHYIHQNYLLTLRRQDPYGQYQLYYSNFPKDPYGDKFHETNYIFKDGGNVC